MQICSGILLTLYYEPRVRAFLRVQKLCLEIKFSFLLQALHLNCSTFIFLFLYLHLLKGLIFCSFHNKPMWVSGITLLFLIIAISFLGYVLPWGQISLWGATVITNLLRVLPLMGQSLVGWLWAGYYVREYTLKLFFTLHFILPIIRVLLILGHLVILHIQGSSNPLGGQLDLKTEFSTYYIYKDSINFFIITLVILFLLWLPHLVRDPENYIECDPLISPVHIQPEWYFLNYYCILRSIPSKSGGVIIFVLSLICLLILPCSDSLQRYYHLKIWWLWCGIFTLANILLIWLGSCPVESPFLQVSQFTTILYFIWFTFSCAIIN